MFGTTDLALFVVSGLLLNITPGPDTLYILGRTASQGRRGGMVAAFASLPDCSCIPLRRLSGCRRLLAASATAFTLLQVGRAAAYLVLRRRLALFCQLGESLADPRAARRGGCARCSCRAS